MIFLGIDPGQSGGLAWIVGGEAQTLAIPDTERDVWVAISGGRAEYIEPVFAVIERVHSMPKQGVASSFKFGQSYGFLRCCLIASGIPFEEVTPQVWQREMGIKAIKLESKTDHKNRTKAKAQQLFPDLKITHATADALLLAAYAQRLYAKRNP